MNKGISLAIVAVLLCAMGIIFFMNFRAANNEPNIAQAPLTEIAPQEIPAEVPLTENGEARPATPQDGAAVLPRIGDPKASPTSQAKTSVPPQSADGSGKAPTTAPTQVASKNGTPQPAQTTSTGQAQPTDSGQSSRPQSTDPKTPDLKTDTTSSPQGDAQAPSLKPLEPQKPAQATSSTATTTPQDGHSLSKIGLHFKGNDIYLRIEADSAFKTKVFALTGPDRLVVDLVGKWHNVTAPTIPANQLVTKARIGTQPNATRLVLDLSRSTKFIIDKPSDSVIEILMR